MKMVPLAGFEPSYLPLMRRPLMPNELQRRWMRERDLNPRPLGYEPNKLPDCSISQQNFCPNFKH